MRLRKLPLHSRFPLEPSSVIAVTAAFVHACTLVNESALRFPVFESEAEEHRVQ
jgi:hypothetical protein